MLKDEKAEKEKRDAAQEVADKLDRLAGHPCTRYRESFEEARDAFAKKYGCSFGVALKPERSR